MLFRKSLFKRPAPAVAGTSFVLDTLTATALFGVSTRRLRTGYSTNALLVNASGGAGTSNIGFVGQDLDTSTLHTFVGANNGTINTWYDQVGANNCANTTVAQQPTIRTGSADIVTTTSKVWASGAANQGLPNGIVRASSYTLAFVAALDVAANNTIIGTQFAGGHCGISSTGGSAWGMGNANNSPSGGSADTSIHGFVAIFDTSSLTLIVDGSTVINGSATTFDSITSGFDLWDFGNAVHIAEVLMFAGVLSGPDQTLLAANWHTYWGTA